VPLLDKAVPAVLTLQVQLHLQRGWEGRQWQVGSGTGCSWFAQECSGAA
jgi:hypothetical protein